MKVTPIANPLPSEQLAAISPPLAPDVRDYWNRRLNLYPGRALSAEALTMEQEGRAGQLATYGQSLSPGVVSGLQVALEPEITGQRSRWFYNIAAGLGLTHTGEDVVLPHGVRVDVLKAEVYAPKFTFERPASPVDLQSYGTTLYPRQIGPSLRQVIADRAVARRTDDETLPRVGILVLQPVTLEALGSANPTDPCEEDPQNYSFEDWQLVDGCRLLWYAWPLEWRPLPIADEQRRNRIAYTIFEAERELGPDQLLPWEGAGVALGLVAFNRRWKPFFFDRPSVVRAGGKPKRRTPALPRVGNAFLWQARIEQFASQLADVDLASSPARSLSAQFRFIPPAGLLPRIVMRPRSGHQDFFPLSYRVDAVPVPVEQLDAALEASAPLAPFDLSTPDEVQVLVPVPQQWYEPDLLKIEEVSPLFVATIDKYVQRRDKLVGRRAQVRDRGDVLDGALGRMPVEWPDPDPRALEPEQEATNVIDTEDKFLTDPELDYGVQLKDGAIDTVETSLPEKVDETWVNTGVGDIPAAVPARPFVRALEKLRSYLRAASPVMRTYTQVNIPKEIGTKVLTEVKTYSDGDLQRRIGYNEVTSVLSLRGPMSLVDYERLERISVDAQYKKAIRSLLFQSQADDIVKLDTLGVSGFITMLEQKVNAADDKVDLAFARVQTDIYRLRQLMLGSEAATRLATSPVLASIAKGESAVATRDTLKTFVSDLKAQTPETFPLDADVAQPKLPARESAQPIGGTMPAPPPPVVAPAGTRLAIAPSEVFVAGGGVREAAFSILPDYSLLTVERAPLAYASLTTTQLLTKEAALRPTALPVIGVSRDDVVEQSPLVGKALDFRTVTLAERLEQPKAAEAKNYAVSTKADILKTLADLDINFDDLAVPGFYEYDHTKIPVELVAKRIYDKPESDPTRRVLRLIPKERTHTIVEIKTFSLIDEVLNGKHDLDPLNADESAFFAAAVRTLDYVVALLRHAEGRIQAYRATLERCKKTAAELASLRSRVDSRLAVIEGELTETRNDVAVARALLADEIVRVAKINARRDHVVETHARFYAFRRPRMLDLLEGAPARRLDPAYTEAALPMCLSRKVRPPRELMQVVNLLRDVPLKWLRVLPPVLDRLDRVELMAEAMQEAKVRAAVQYQTQLLRQKLPPSTGQIGDSIHKVFGAQRDLVTQKRVQTAQIDLSTFAEQTWKRIRAHAEDILSPGDLADGSHGNAEVTHACAEELRNIAHVAACLYAEFGEVLPSLRLQWADQLGQYDDTVPLRNLASLPGWGDIEYLERREMQGMVDWLFGRLDPRVPEASKLMNDIVRIALLLASHAPVNEIIASDVQTAATVSEGEQLELAADLEKVRVGMQVLMYAPQPPGKKEPPQIVARAVVQDIGAGKVAAVIVHTVQPTVSLEKTSKAHFVTENHPAVAAAPSKPEPREIGEKPKALGAKLLGKAYR